MNIPNYQFAITDKTVYFDANFSFLTIDTGVTMALKEFLRSIGDGLSNEVKDAGMLLQRIRLTTDTTPLGANFRKYGPSFGTYEYDAFIRRAKDFFKEGMASQDSQYTRVALGDDRVAIDYNSEIRGVFTGRGRPLAFFRPDYKELGYPSRSAELAAFKAGKSLPFN